jgi:pimeloyl-ACP methyl ester carboxylesterase
MKKKLKVNKEVHLVYFHSKPKNNKPTLFFVHGVGGNWSIWEKSIAHAKKDGYGVLAVDLRGHGISSYPEDKIYYYLEDLAKDLGLILKKEKIKDFIFITHSFGGAIALIYTTRFKDLSPKAVVAICSTFRYPFKKYHELNTSPVICYPLRKLVEWKVITNKSFPRFPELDLFKVLKENLLFHFFDELYYTSFKSIFNCLDSAKEYCHKFDKKNEDLLRKLNIPVLLIAGEQDNIIPKKYSEELHSILPDSKYKLLKGNHLIPLLKNSEMNSEIFSFLIKLKL